MKNTKQTGLIITVAIIGLVGGVVLNQQLNRLDTEHKPQATQETSQSDHRPEFSLEDLDGKTRQMREWDGKVVMVNFWATWCPPCRDEMPAFVKLHEKYKDKGFEIVGIALDEKQAIIDFVDPLGVEYPILLGEQDGIAITQAYGNRLGVLPYTVIVDRQGKMTHQHRNELTFEQAESLITPLL